jgi:2-polyprenyl-6-methoxyphenol hydroxylase-like FAD-dependent oxidoreductase
MPQSATREVLLRHGERTQLLQTRIVLAATGMTSASAGVAVAVAANSRLGAGVVLADPASAYAPGLIHLATGTHGYVGLVRIEDGRLNVAAALDPAGVKAVGGLGTAAAMILAEAGLPPVPDLAAAAWRGTPLLTRTVVRPWAERVFLLGDAAGYVEPFTGEGMAWAFASAMALAPLAWEACRGWKPHHGHAWAQMRRRRVTRRQWLIRALAEGLRWPRLTHGVVRLLAAAPWLATPMVRWLNQEPY